MVDTDHAALRPWNNAARKSLPRGVLAWLGLLVATCLASVFFVASHQAARWVLGGFLISHVIVFVGPLVCKSLDLRAGLVSLLHIVCWSPGLVFAGLDLLSGSGVGVYVIWSWAIVIVTAISFFFDFRDASIYVMYLVRRD